MCTDHPQGTCRRAVLCVGASLHPALPLHAFCRRLGPPLARLVPQLHGGQRGAGSLSTHLLLTDLHVQVSVFRSHKSCWITLASPCPRSPCRAWGRWCDPVCKGPGRACCGRGCEGACRSQAATSEVGRGEAGSSRAHSPQKCKGQRASSHAFCSAATKHSCRGSGRGEPGRTGGVPTGSGERFSAQQSPGPLFQPHSSNPSHFQSRSRAAAV